ncbi:MAG: DinB family protein [Crocinitomicaceae bacterium]|nr:DinB family protein [Crocinitomicaceae bacterium]
MNLAHYLSTRISEVFLNGKWIANTNYKEQLESVSLEQALKTVGQLNSIAALTYHVNYYVSGVLNVLKGGKLEISDKFSFDMPALDSDAQWKKLKDDFQRNAQDLALHIEQMDDTKLNEIFVDERYGTYCRNIEALIEHGYYHLGQISLIRKLIGTEKN